MIVNLISLTKYRKLIKFGLALFIFADVNLFYYLAYAAEPASQMVVNVYPTNRKMSFNFQNIDLRTLLQLIAKQSGMNFIISDEVKGNVSLNLKNVTWREALDTLLRTQGLTSRQVGNVIFVSTIEDITNNETKQYHSVEQEVNLSPLRSRLIRLKYTSAADLAVLLKGPQSSLLSPRGQVAVDTRTNSVIIRDTRENLADILPTIQRLDIPARQVLIEARIVNIDTTYEEQLGIRFGVTKPEHLTGTLEGGNSLNQGINPAFIQNVANQIDYTKRLNFNVPASALFDGTNPGSIALALARISGVLLDLELSAMEGERHAQVIAKPRVVTSNQQKAMIQTGEEIPYQEATSSGATAVVFKKAVLSLTIVPQITPDNRIVLHLRATEDTRGDSVTIGTTGTTTTQIPSINTQEVESHILLNNNETIVIGGVYRTIAQKTTDRIPFFGTLPLVGFLFRHNGLHNEKHELLIFITPKIIKSSMVPIAQAEPRMYPRGYSLKGDV